MFKKILPYIKNKYLVTFIAFIVWIMFFDNHNIISQVRLTKELNKIKADKQFYIDEIEKDKKTSNELMTDPECLEKYAREHYLMKKDDEDIFLIIKEEKED